MVRIARILNMIAAAITILLIAVIVFSVVRRYMFHSPVRFGDELVGLLFAMVCFLPLALGAFEGRHVSVTLVTRSVSDRTRALLNLFATAIFCLFCTVFAYQSYLFTLASYRFNATSEVGGLLLYPWMAMMPLAMLFTLAAALIRLRDQMRGKAFDPEAEDPVIDL